MGERIQRLKEKAARVKAADARMDLAVKGLLAEKKDRLKHDPQYLALWAVEFFLIIALVSAVYFYLDPEINVVPAPLNYVVFAAIAAAVFWLYRYTEDYRKLLEART